MRYDYFYPYSDDRDVYKYGLEEEKRLKALVANCGFDVTEVFKLLAVARS